MAPRELRAYLIGWLGNAGLTHAITLNPNMGDMSITRLRKLFGLFCLEVDRFRFAKRRVNGVPSDDRLQAWAFPEHLGSNAHLHAAANMSSLWLGRRWDFEWEMKLHAVWDQVTRGRGQLDIREVFDSVGWINYVTKELSGRCVDQLRTDVDFIWAADFHPSASVLQSGKLNNALEQLALESIHKF